MVMSRFSKMRIAGVAVTAPDNPRSIDEDIALFDHDPAKLARAKKIIGFGTRYVGFEGWTGTDLAEAAARHLFEGLKIDAAEIDMIICAIPKPDYIQPGSSFVLHRELKLPKTCAAIDINHSCSGFVYGLWLAGGLLESGACRKILLSTGEHYRYPPGQRDALLFSDGGSATLLEYDPQAAPSWFNIQADGRSVESLVVPAGGGRLPLDHELMDLRVESWKGETLNLINTYLNGLEVFHFTIREVPPNIKALLEYAGLDMADIDFLVSHQANKQIVDQVAARLALKPDQYSAATFTAYGNHGPGSIPCVLAHQLRDKITGGRQRVIMSGFGIGTAWGSAIMNLEKIYCPGIILEKFSPKRSREEEIGYWVKKLADGSGPGS